MATLLKRANGFPSFGAMMEDFWNSNGFFGPSFLKTMEVPAVNIKETKKGYELEVAAPGFKKEDFKVTTDKGVLTISAETKSEKQDEDENYTRREFSCTSFTRTFNLPDDVTDDKINAAYQHGVLTIDLKRNGKALPEPKEVKID